MILIFLAFVNSVFFCFLIMFSIMKSTRSPVKLDIFSDLQVILIGYIENVMYHSIIKKMVNHRLGLLNHYFLVFS